VAANDGCRSWDDLAPVVAEIVAHVGRDDYVLPAQRFRNPPFNTERQDLLQRPSSSQALRQLVMRAAARAGIAAHIHPHLLRHAFAGHIARRADTRSAQHLLGHASIGTTDTYLGKPTLDEMVAAVSRRVLRHTNRRSRGSKSTRLWP